MITRNLLAYEFVVKNGQAIRIGVIRLLDKHHGVVRRHKTEPRGHLAVYDVVLQRILALVFGTEYQQWFFKCPSVLSYTSFFSTSTPSPSPVVSMLASTTIAAILVDSSTVHGIGLDIRREPSQSRVAVLPLPAASAPRTTLSTVSLH